MSNSSANPALRPSHVGPWLFASLAILCSFALTRLYHQGRLGNLFGAPVEEGHVALSTDEVEAWQGLLELEDGRLLSCLLVPFHSDPEWQRFRSASLAGRWELPAGELMRLVLELYNGQGEPLSITGFELLDEGGSCVQPLAASLPTDWEGDPLLTLLARRGAILDPLDSEQIAGWGRRPGEGARLLLQHAGGELSVPLEPKSMAPGDIPRSFAQKSAAGASQPEPGTRALGPEALLQRLLELEQQLALERARVVELESARVLREEEILRFNELLAGLPLPSELRAELGLTPEESATKERELELKALPLDPALLRAGEIKLALRTLLTLEGVYALDLLEVGELHEPSLASEELDENGESVSVPAQAGWVGPVLFRLLDSFGRLNGSLHAERLHLEGSRASRMLHVILSAGYESHQGVRTPFEAGTRRISLPLVDPERWIERLPELFSPAEWQPENDDGLWDLGALRLELNALLAQGSMAGWFRFHGFGGVMGEDLREVQLQEFDNKGHMRRRLFADQLRLCIDENGVSLRLSGGAIADAEGMHPFRNGVHSIFLPAADPEEWRQHKLPGLPPPAEQDEP